MEADERGKKKTAMAIKDGDSLPSASHNPFRTSRPFSGDDDGEFSLLSDSSSRPAKFQPRFRPKGSKLAPLSSDLTKDEEKEERTVELDDDDVELPTDFMEVDNGIRDVEMEDPIGEVGMSQSECGNRVVREIDVFFKPSPIDEDCLLYLMQYPLRPSWRPYELDEKCEEVRVKPKQCKVEVGLRLDTDNGNYDQEVDESLRIKKQILSSSKAPTLTSYAIGLLKGNQLFLNPINAVVQLRPSMTHRDAFNESVVKGQTGIREVTNSNKETGEKSLKTPQSTGKSFAEPTKQQSTRISYAQLKQEDDMEAWIPLEYSGTESSQSAKYRDKMIIEDVSSPIDFSMSLDDYVNSLVPTRPRLPIQAKSHDDGKLNGISGRNMMLSWEDRIQEWLTKGHKQVSGFKDLMKLAEDSTEQDVLQVLKQNAHLIQGLWVPKSTFRYEEKLCMVRDFILLSFYKNRIIEHEQLKKLKVSEDALKLILTPLAIKKPGCEAWEFNQPTDRSFLNSYPSVVKEQQQTWLKLESQIYDMLFQSSTGMTGTKTDLARNRPVSHISKSGSVEQHTSKGSDGVVSSLGMSEEAQEALLKALHEVFLKYHVCSLQLIVQGLCGMAVNRTSLPKANSNHMVDIAHIASTSPKSELQAVISQVAIEVHGVYMLKSLNNTTYDPFRNFVIGLFAVREPKGKLKKSDICEAYKLAHHKDVPKDVYNKVMKELCCSSGSAWMLKSGDGKPF